MQQPLVSIIIPTYNQAGFIQSALEGACNQTYPRLEIVVSDDHSSDATWEILEKYKNDHRIKIFRNPSRLGRVGNYRNALYNQASGELALFCDGDDYLTEVDFIKNAVDAILRLCALDEFAFYQGGHRMKEQESSDSVNCLPRFNGNLLKMNGPAYVRKFESFRHFSHLATLYNRKKALEAGFYKESILSSDMDSLLRLAFSGYVILSKAIAGVWLQHGSNASSNATTQKLIENLIWIKNVRDYAIQKGYSRFVFNCWSIRTELKEYAMIYYRIGSTLAIQEKYKEVIALFIEFIGRRPLLLIYPVFIKKTLDILFRKKTNR